MQSFFKKQDRIIKYVFTDFKPQITSPSGIVLEELAYEGKLEFTLDLVTGEIVINEFPTLKNKGIYSASQDKILLFTSDLAKLIKAESIKEIDSEKLHIVFKAQLALVAMDDKTAEIFPNVKSTRSFVSLKKNLALIDKEIAQIETRVKAEKAHQDRLLRSQEMTIVKRSKIKGLSPFDYTNQAEFDAALR